MSPAALLEAMRNPVNQPAIFLDIRGSTRSLTTGIVTAVDTIAALSTADQDLSFNSITYRALRQSNEWLSIVDVTPPTSMNMLERSSAEVSIFDTPDANLFGRIERYGRPNVQCRIFAGFKSDGVWRGLLTLFTGYVHTLTRGFGEDGYITRIGLQTQIFKADARSAYVLSDTEQRRRAPNSRALEYIHRPEIVNWGTKSASGLTATPQLSLAVGAGIIRTAGQTYDFAVGPGIAGNSVIEIQTDNPAQVYRRSFTGTARQTFNLALLDDRAVGSALTRVTYAVRRIRGERNLLLHNFTILYGTAPGAPQVQWFESASSTAEGRGAHRIRIVVNQELASAIQVGFTLGGSADRNDDYTISATSVTIAANSAEVEVPVTIIDDAAREGAETITLTLQGGTGYRLGSRTLHTITIAASDQPADAVTIALNAAAVTANEGDTINVAVVTPRALGSGLTIGFAVTGTAARADWSIPGVTGTTGTVRIATGDRTANIPVTITDDAAFEEGTETVIVTLTAGNGYTLEAPTAQTITIAESDRPLPVVQWSKTSDRVREGGFVTLDLAIATAYPTDLPITYAITGSAATTDYAIAGTTRITAGTTSTRLTITVTDDTLAENTDETLVLTLDTDARWTLGTRDEYTLTILRSDVPPDVFFSTTAVDAVEGQTVTVTVEADVPPDGNIDIGISVSGSAAAADYTITGLTSGNLRLSAGTTSATFTVRITDDTTAEIAVETVILTIDTGTGYGVGTDSEQTISIAGSDVPRVQFSRATASAEEGDSVTVDLQSDIAPAANTNIAMDIGGSADIGATGDYTIAGGTVSGSILTAVLTAGQRTRRLTIAVRDDTDNEAAETATLALRPGTNYLVGSRDEYALTIAASDRPPTLEFSSAAETVREGTTLTVTVEADIAPESNVTVNFGLGESGATHGDDFTITGFDADAFTFTRTLASGATTLSFDIPIASDSVTEQAEIFSLFLDPGTGYDVGTESVLDVTIAADNAPTVQWSSAASAADEGDTVTVTAGVAQALSYDLTIDYTLGGSLDSTEYTDDTSGQVTISAGATSVNASITITQDATREDNPETVTLSIDSSSEYVIGTNRVHTITVAPSDVPGVNAPNVTWGSLVSHTAEGLMVTLTINFDQAALGERTVGFTLGGSAAAADYTVTPATGVTIAQGAVTANVVVAIADDAAREGPETLTLTLTGGSATTYRLPTQTASRVHTVNIAASDFPIPGAGPGGFSIESVTVRAFFVLVNARFADGVITGRERRTVKMGSRNSDGNWVDRNSNPQSYGADDQTTAKAFIRFFSGIDANAGTILAFGAVPANADSDTVFTDDDIYFQFRLFQDGTFNVIGADVTPVASPTISWATTASTGEEGRNDESAHDARRARCIRRAHGHLYRRRHGHGGHGFQHRRLRHRGHSRGRDGSGDPCRGARRQCGFRGGQDYRADDHRRDGLHGGHRRDAYDFAGRRGGELHHGGAAHLDRARRCHEHQCRGRRRRRRWWWRWWWWVVKPRWRSGRQWKCGRHNNGCGRLDDSDRIGRRLWPRRWWRRRIRQERISRRGRCGRSGRDQRQRGQKHHGICWRQAGRRGRHR